MSIKFAAFILIIAFVVNSCSRNNNQNIESRSHNVSDTFTKQQSKPTDTLKSIEQSKTKSDTITELTFSEGVNSLSIKGRLDKPGDVAMYSFTVNKSARLTGRITVDKGPANIRFNQIVMPDGQSDGPFGQQLDYTLAQKGVYKIKIGQSLMAENAFVGDFLFHLTVQ